MDSKGFTVFFRHTSSARGALTERPQFCSAGSFSSGVKEIEQGGRSYLYIQASW